MAEIPERDAARLLDMLLAARDALEFADGLTEERFLSSRLHQNAIIRSLEVIGEAAGHVSPDTTAAVPTIPWWASFMSPGWRRWTLPRWIVAGGGCTVLFVSHNMGAVQVLQFLCHQDLNAADIRYIVKRACTLADAPWNHYGD